MRKTGVVLAAFAVCYCLAGSAAAQEMKLQEVTPQKIGLGGTAVVTIANLGPALAAGKHKLSDFVLYLDDQPVAFGAEPGATGADNELSFSLTRTSKNSTAWTKLQQSAAAVQKTVQVGVRLAGQSSPLPTEKGTPLTATLMVVELKKMKTDAIGLGENAVVKVDGLGPVLAKGKVKLSDFVLYLDGHAVASGAEAGLTNAANDELGFTLTRTSKNNTAWTALLGSPTTLSKVVQVDVGLAGQSSVLPTENGKPLSVKLDVVWGYGLWLGGLFMILVIILLVYIGTASDLLRDREPADFGGATGPNGKTLRRPFSLALSQMSWWLALVLGAYIFLFIITGDINTLTAQALTLMGIGTGTALGASMIQNTKTDKVQQDFKAVLNQIDAAGGAAKAPADVIAKRDRLAIRLASTGNYFLDILTDENGLSLHRFQVLAWSLIIGIIFCFAVYRELALPAFDGTILAVLGISAGTYLGFKVPEKPV